MWLFSGCGHFAQNDRFGDSWAFLTPRGCKDQIGDGARYKVLRAGRQQALRT